MGTPTLPSMWSDVLTQLNTILAWDIVKGFMIMVIGIFLATLAMQLVSRAIHRG